MTFLPDLSGIVWPLVLSSAVSMVFGAVLARVIGSELLYAFRTMWRWIRSLLKGER